MFIELQMRVNVLQVPITVILMQLAMIFLEVILARATLDLRAMVFLAQVIACFLTISSLATSCVWVATSSPTSALNCTHQKR